MEKPQRIRVPFTCPHCGENGAVRVNKLDRSIRCKICETVFHVDRRLEVAFGSPESAPPAYKGRKGADFRADLHPKWVRRLRKWMTPARAAVCAAIVFLFAALIWFVFPNQSDEPLPTTLAGRLKYFAENWVENDVHGIRHVTDPSVRSFVDQWWKLSKRTLGGIDSVDALELTVLFENRKEGTASTVISVRGSTDRNAGFVLFWKLQSDQTWLFDPKLSIRDAGHRDTE